MRKENALNDFLKTTYSSKSPVPYILSAQIFLFVIIHLCDLLVEVNVLNFPLYDVLLSKLSLPANITKFISQPWSLLTFPFLYTGLFKILFDSLWMYWLGHLFLGFLNSRQFLTLFFGAVLIAGPSYLGLAQIPLIANNPQGFMHTNAFSIAALMCSLLVLSPRMEVRLFLFGNVRFQTIAIVYMAIEFIFLALINKPAAGAFLIAGGWGMLFMEQLKNGRDISSIFARKSVNKLRVVHTIHKSPIYKSHKADLPNQEIIDEILDKISQYGYESLSSREKEILFKVSREEQE